MINEKTKERSGIREGDLLMINFSGNNFLLLSIGRDNKDCSSERFEGTMNDNKELIYGYPSNLGGAQQLTMFIAQITGLQARQINKSTNHVSFCMEAGESLLLDI
jgi:hypothetical protein